MSENKTMYGNFNPLLGKEQATEYKQAICEQLHNFDSTGESKSATSIECIR